jgi:hypothetical protein
LDDIAMLKNKINTLRDAVDMCLAISDDIIRIFGELKKEGFASNDARYIIEEIYGYGIMLRSRCNAISLDIGLIVRNLMYFEKLFKKQ